ncbi:MAG: TIR domain-containing protein [Candidatus Thioglobus sp.]|uniref:TIR domain-containing protein n=1 Tax=Candidatus Thioglobus sp. TaxID=2026721 RepID=UPI00261CC26C|nr:TIR domain-containing protein [Candidatus Thioglobus sp.]MDC9726922.1 TIR domain-containing protein [Candidatus Thioglobus sp.]
MSSRHNVFVSYHHKNDEDYKLEFERIFSDIYDVLETKAVSDGDIDPYLKTETIRQKIRDEFIRDASVTIVLIGSETWKRKHVDWEISSSIRSTRLNSRTGLLGIILPTYPKYSKGTIPPRLQDNIDCKFAKIYNWSDDPSLVQSWIHEAFLRRKRINPDNSRDMFAKNRSDSSWC